MYVRTTMLRFDMVRLSEKAAYSLMTEFQRGGSQLTIEHLAPARAADRP